jgi:dipeptidyl aminopeptidase/acylaminoacyl peptidase
MMLMKKICWLVLGASPLITFSQNKKPLDHSVYDSWESIGEKIISNNGAYVAYTINPQEGDGKLVIQKATGEMIAEVSRGYSAAVSADNSAVIFKIRPWFQETHQAKIQKKKPEELPKDSLGIYPFKTGKLQKYARVRSYELPEKGENLLAIRFETPEKKKGKTDSTVASNSTSPTKVATPANVPTATPVDEIKKTEEGKDEGGDLVLKNLVTGKEKTFKSVLEYSLSKTGKKLLFETRGPKKDSLTKATVQLYDLASDKTKILMQGVNEAKNFIFDEDAKQLAFVAERDSSTKALQKFYKLYYYKGETDSALLLADRLTSGVPKSWTISEFAKIEFSKTGKRLLFGTTPILPPKDTSVPEVDRVNVDIWSYKDDFLQPQQLKTRDRDEKRSFLATYDWEKQKVVQLADEWINPVFSTSEGDGAYFYGVSDSGMRVAGQWQGFTFKKLYAINPANGKATTIVSNFKGTQYPSYTGKYLLMYDEKDRQYSVYNSLTAKRYVVSTQIKYPLYDEENDVPDDPNAYGIMGWQKNDEYVYVYDRYSIWKVDPENKKVPSLLTPSREVSPKISYRYINITREEEVPRQRQVQQQESIDPSKDMYFKAFNETSKRTAIARINKDWVNKSEIIAASDSLSINYFAKADSADAYIYTMESFKHSPDLYSTSTTINLAKNTDQKAIAGWHTGDLTGIKLFTLNSQQNNYLWGNAELFKWTAYTGKLTEGVLYKPENFDPNKKYPMIVYFYERNNNTLYTYQAPAPTPSRLNIPFFVSRGYVVFVPDIWYKTGHPGQSAYDYIVSGTRAVIKKGFIDSTKLGLQGQSWGGYQIAYLITRTNLFAAAWAGAPVANMTSAYGGIRWGTGLTRQFQYEKTQSRIGATLWEKPQLYIENSPLFHLPKVKTPLVIMSNDADDAVPWYQGIELFTAMRRLDKRVWLLNYNNEAHNLVERKNRKDISIREQQFFDWMLKGEKPAPWLAEGVPALMKGRTLGL